MNLVGYVVMPIIKNERSYLINIPMGSPFDEAREVLQEALANIDQMQADAKAADEKRSAESALEPEVSDGSQKCS